MKKIYWFLQQLKDLGGTETATISIANLLVSNYDITLVITSNEPNSIPYNIDKKIKIIYLNNDNSSKIDEKILRFCSEKKYFKALFLIFKNIYFVLFGKYKYRKIVKNMTTPYDILIASSLDNYLIIPKKRKYIYHYHYNYNFFKSFNERFMFRFYNKANEYVFLNEKIFDDINAKYSFFVDKSLYILNPIKTSFKKDFNYYDNSLIFIGRFADQKNPLMLIDVAKILKDKKLNFKLELYGDGKLLESLIRKINDYKLNDVVSICKPIKNIEIALRNKDVLLLTSLYEGTPLVINEAFSQSVTCVTTNFGDSTLSSVPLGTGIIIDSFDPEIFADKLFEFLSNKNKLINYKINAYKYSLHYSNSIIKEKWIKLIESL